MSRLLFGSEVARWLCAGLGCLFLSAAYPSAASQVSRDSAPPSVSGEEVDLAAPSVPAGHEQAEPAAQNTSPATSPSPVGREDEGLSNRLLRVDRELDEVDALLVSSHFHVVLSVAECTRDLLSTLEGEPELGARRARLEVMAATAEIALGRRTMAQQSMIRALQAEPALSLDEHKTSPKVLELLAEARRRAHIGKGKP